MIRTDPRKLSKTLDLFLTGIEQEVGGGGFEWDSFRSFTLSHRVEGDQYARARVRVKFDRDGKLSCEQYEISDDDTVAIQGDLAKEMTDWPRSTSADHIDGLLRNLKGIDPIDLFVFRDLSNNVLFVQQRVYNDDGTKRGDMPWTYWGDGQWRRMNPDGPLPLFGLEQDLHNTRRIFLHEGAKSALWVRSMFDNERTWQPKRPEGSMLIREKAPHLTKENCPWYGDLLHGVHLGWPGGAPNPRVVDWSPLCRLGADVEFVIVCDNDPVGVAAAQKISRLLEGHRCKALRFDASFIEGFDLAEPFPLTEHKGAQIYRGPSFDDCLRPATWATRRCGEGYGMYDTFAKEWHSLVKPAAFVHHDNLGKVYTESEFSRKVAPFSDVSADRLILLLTRQAPSQIDGLTYVPGGAATIARGGDHLLNTYTPPAIVPEKGNVLPFLRFMRHLIPNPTDRAHVLKLCAMLIAKPEVRVLYGLLLISEKHGVGKSTLQEIIKRLVGRVNCSSPSVASVLSEFNEWAARRLVVIPEIKDGSGGRLYTKLKSYITDTDFDVRRMYMSPYNIDNWLSVFASSNYSTALKLEEDDRRWLVPAVAENVQPLEYWKRLYNWLDDGGLSNIAYWSRRYLEKHGELVKGETAPMSVRKARAIYEGKAEGEKIATDLARAILDLRVPAVVILSDVHCWINHGSKEMLLGSEKISYQLRKAGMSKHPSERGLRCPGGRVRVFANFELGRDMNWEKLDPFFLPLKDDVGFGRVSLKAALDGHIVKLATDPAPSWLGPRMKAMLDADDDEDDE
jgi:uncharacterized protein DUF5906